MFNEHTDRSDTSKENTRAITMGDGINKAEKRSETGSGRGCSESYMHGST